MTEMVHSERNRVRNTVHGKTGYLFNLKAQLFKVGGGEFAVQGKPTQGVLLPWTSPRGKFEQFLVRHRCASTPSLHGPRKGANQKCAAAIGNSPSLGEFQSCHLRHAAKRGRVVRTGALMQRLRFNSYLLPLTEDSDCWRHHQASRADR